MSLPWDQTLLPDPTCFARRHRRLLEYLAHRETDFVSHTGSSLLVHLYGVGLLLSEWEMPDAVVVAGLGHSLYGTEGFKHMEVGVSERAHLREVLGDEAEKIVYTYCALTYASLRNSLSSGSVQLEDRFLDQPLICEESTFLQILWIQLANQVEQDLRCPEAERMDSEGVFWDRVANRAGARGLEMLARYRTALHERLEVV